MNFNRAGRWLVGLCVVGGFASPARAVVTEPNGLQVPLPASTVEVQLASDFTPSSVVSLKALFEVRGETFDWQKDALTTPAVFSPLCTFTGELVLHGGACHIDFGWYNVVPGRTGPPPDSEIYPIIKGAVIPGPWHPGVGEAGPTFTTASIRADANYQGGLIGFALKGDPGADCKQTHFSEQELNVTCTNCTPNKPWAAAVIWQSTKTPNAYYIGFEDLGMSPTDFGGLPGQPYRNDGDFNDFVYFLSGVTCEGGGTPCDTTLPGVCAAGLNECVTGTRLTCRPSVNPSPEVCDGLDNDCNGTVDDLAKCPQSQVCDRGVCVLPCSVSEFPCAPGYTCENKLCVDAACVGKTCAAGQICTAGACVGSCDGVTCPRGQACRTGRCVDPCDGVTCDADRVCEGGVCITACKCRGCADDKTCQASGLCVDKGCADKVCATGEVCVAGACVDGCNGASCPRGQACMAGACVDSPNAPGGGGGPAHDGGTSTGGAGSGGGGTSHPDAAVDAAGSPQKISPGNGCRCDAGGPSGAGGGLVLALLGALGLWATRRRPASRS